ncbi:MAG: carboxypeptidase-like regulatory domain-containing protein [Bacteroidales bacterium]
MVIKSLISVILKSILILAMVLLPSLSKAQTGSLKGVISDKKTNETVIGANVLIVGTQTGVVSDINGNFQINNLKPGKYNVQVSFISYKTRVFEKVIINAEKVTDLGRIELEEESTSIKGVTIQERRKTDTEISMISSIKKSDLVISAVSSQQIARSQDKDASEVIRRVPGITIINNRFVVVRGLVERYNNVLLNNAAAPSSESDVKAFSFDAISSGLLDRILVYKTPAPELPADFAGAAIQIFTKNLPEKNSVNFGYSAGFQSGTTFNDFYRYKSGKTDWLGFDDGSRGLPDVVPSSETMLYEYQNFADGLPPEIVAYRKAKLTEIGRSFSKISVADKMTAPFNNKLSFDLTRRIKGKGFDIGNITSVSYSSSFSYDRIQRSAFETYDTIKDASVYVYDYQDAQYANNINISALHNWSVLIGNTTLEFRNLMNQTGRTRTTSRTGVDYYRSGNRVQSYELDYMSRTTYSGQVGGTHKLNQSNTLLNWTLGYSYVFKDEPDMRRIYKYSSMQVDENGDTTFTPYQYDYSSTVNTESNGRLFIKTKENIINLGVNLEQKIQLGTFIPELKAGFYAEKKERSFGIRSFGIARSVPLNQFDQDIFTQPLDNIYADTLINFINGIKIIEDTKPEYSYLASNDLFAAYLGLKLPVTSSFNAYLGLRIEQNKQKLSGFQAKDDTLTPNILKDTLNLFPSANLTYNFSSKSLIRLAYGLTINRPEFREIAPYAFYDFEQSATIYGNDSLKNAYIHNLDLRFEYYPSVTEMITVGAFYKDFIDPIEMNFFPASNGWDFVFVNSEESKNFGLELDMRKSLQDFGNRSNLLRYLKDLTLVFNASVIKSEMVSDLPYVRDRKRQMAGQSPYIINLGIYYNNESNGLSASILYNVIGKRIMIVGTPQRPHIYEMPRNVLDVNVSKKFGKHLVVKAGIKDILNEKYLFQQYETFNKNGDGDVERIQVIRSWRPGSMVNLSVNYSL